MRLWWHWRRPVLPTDRTVPNAGIERRAKRVRSNELLGDGMRDKKAYYKEWYAKNRERLIAKARAWELEHP